MDEVDVRILNCLKKNARENASAIADRVEMSVSAVIERVRKLENAGVIQQYTTVLDPKKIGKDVLAYIFIGLEHPKYNEGFSTFVRKNKNILEGNYITGDFDFLLKISTDSTEQLEKLLNEIKSVQGVSITRTIVVLSNLKSEFAVTL